MHRMVPVNLDRDAGAGDRAAVRIGSGALSDALSRTQRGLGQPGSVVADAGDPAGLSLGRAGKCPFAGAMELLLAGTTIHSCRHLVPGCFVASLAQGLLAVFRGFC